MTQINITLEEEILKDLFMGNREKSKSILLEQVINAVLNQQVTAQLNAGHTKEVYHRHLLILIGCWWPGVWDF